MSARRTFVAPVQRSGDCESQVMDVHVADCVRASASFSCQFAGPLNLLWSLIVFVKRLVVNVIKDL